MSKSTDHTQALRDVRENVTVLQALARSLHVIARRPIGDDAGAAITAIADLASFHLVRSADLLDDILSLCRTPEPATPKPKP